MAIMHNLWIRNCDREREAQPDTHKKLGSSAWAYTAQWNQRKQYQKQNHRVWERVTFVFGPQKQYSHSRDSPPMSILGKETVQSYPLAFEPNGTPRSASIQLDLLTHQNMVACPNCLLRMFPHLCKGSDMVWGSSGRVLAGPRPKPRQGLHAKLSTCAQSYSLTLLSLVLQMQPLGLIKLGTVLY